MEEDKTKAIEKGVAAAREEIEIEGKNKVDDQILPVNSAAFQAVSAFLKVTLLSTFV